MKRAKILIVEDERTIAADLKLTLENLGYEVTGTVSSADAFYQSIQKEIPDLVLMDILLKGEKNGVELAMEIRTTFGAPVIFLTAYSDVSLLEKAKLAEPFGYILKPFQIVELQTAIEIALQKSRMEKRILHLNLVLKAIRDTNQLIVKGQYVVDLIEGSCKTLIATRDYAAVWIILMNGDGLVTEAASAGLLNGFDEFVEKLKGGFVPDCIKSLNEIPGVGPLPKPIKHCINCGFRDANPENEIVILKIKYHDILYGYLAISSLFESLEDDEEVALLVELTEDIGYALNNLELVRNKSRADQALHESELWFSNLVDLIPDLIAILDTDHKIVRANEAMARVLGCTKDEAIGQPCYKIVHGLGAIPEFCPHTRTMLSKSEERSEVEEPRLNGTYDVTTTPIFNEHGIVTGSVHVARDISLRKQREHLIAENVALGEFALTHSMNELVTYTIDKAEQLTNSKIGFFHFLDEKSTVTLQGWSTHTREKFCSANAAINHYPLKEAGVWADCIREVRPVIHNDYANLLQKKGMPEGHAVLERELTLPIVRADQVVAVIGVGNKSVDYTESDVECLRQLSNHAWEYIINKRIEGTLHKKITELELLNRLMVDRELKMIELKQEINLLSNKMGEGDRYVIHSK